METKGNDYLKNGMKISKLLYRLKDVNDSMKSPRLIGSRQKSGELKKTAAQLKKEIGRLRKAQENAEQCAAAGSNELCRAFMKRKLTDLEKRICFYLLTLMLEDIGNYRRGDEGEVKKVMNVVCADGITDPVDALCDYMLFGKLQKIDLIEWQRDYCEQKLFEKVAVPSRKLLEAAIGSLMVDNTGRSYNKEKKAAISLLGSAKKTSTYKPELCLDHVILTPELRKNVENFIWFYKKSNKSSWDLKELGVSTGNALFYGPPGTGKTLLAEAIAGELNLEIAKVRYEEIIDCWVGNSEKNIKMVFESGGQKGKVILFDECDAMLEARSSAKDSVDRMNNRVINIILQELERYPGIVIFTTNRAVELDEALGRRILLKMEIPRPGRSEREKIWKKMTTGKVPLSEEIEWSRIADFDLSGGEIKNVILNLAKDPEVNRPEVKITTQNLLTAAKNEVDGRLSGEKKKFGFITN